MTRYIRYYFLCLFLIAAAGETRAQSESLEELKSTISRLERDIRAISRQIYKDGKIPDASSVKPSNSGTILSTSNQYIIRLGDRLAEVKGELQGTTNLIEGLRRDIDELKVRLDKLVGDIDFRLTRVEESRDRKKVNQPIMGSAPKPSAVEKVGSVSGGPIVSSGKPAILGQISETSLNMITSNKTQARPNAEKGSVHQKKTIQKKFLLPDGSPLFQYRHALSILRKTQYDTAELAFKEFIERYPEDKLSSNARYWLGESFYVRKKFLDAADAFLRAYQQSPKGVKAPDSLLKLGMSLANLQKKQDACDVFSQLSKDYPDAPENIKKHLKREYIRSACK